VVTASPSVQPSFLVTPSEVHDLSRRSSGTLRANFSPQLIAHVQWYRSTDSNVEGLYALGKLTTPRRECTLQPGCYSLLLLELQYQWYALVQPSGSCHTPNRRSVTITQIEESDGNKGSRYLFSGLKCHAHALECVITYGST